MKKYGTILTWIILGALNFIVSFFSGNTVNAILGATLVLGAVIMMTSKEDDD